MELKIKATASNALDYIGKKAVCSKGVTGIITGVGKMPWGISFVGFTEKGVAWTSQEPLVKDI